MRKILKVATAAIVSLGLLAAGSLSGAAAVPGPTPPDYPSIAGVFNVFSANGTVRVRRGASTSSTIVGTISSGTSVNVQCSVTNGSSVTASNGTKSTVWDRTDKGWISDTLVKTGTVKAIGLECPYWDFKMMKADEQARDIDFMNQQRVYADFYAPNDYSYSYRYFLGQRPVPYAPVAPETIVADIYNDFDGNFRFQGCGKTVWVGKNCTLRVHGTDAPIHFAEVRARQYSFISLDGHPEGALRVLTMRFWTDSKNHVVLDISAVGPARSILTQQLKAFNGATVEFDWYSFARTLEGRYNLKD